MQRASTSRARLGWRVLWDFPHWPRPAFPAAMWMRLSWRVFWDYPYSMVFAVVAFILAFPMCLRRSGGDWFDVYVPAAAKLWGGKALYASDLLFAYPPLSAFFAGIFLGLPTWGARVLWYGLNVLALAIVLRGCWHLAGLGRVEPVAAVGRTPRRVHVVAILGMLCGIFFAFDTFTNQQNDLHLAALVIGGCLLLNQGRDIWAALLFGLAAALKCTPLLWSAYLLWRRKWLPAAIVAAGAVAFNLVPDAVVPPPDGVPRLQHWVNRYLPGLASRNAHVGVWFSAINFNHSLAGVGNRLLMLHPTWHGADMLIEPRDARPSPLMLRGIVYAVGLGLMIVAVFSSWRARRSAGASAAPDVKCIAGLEFSLVCLLMLLLSPMSSKPHFCTLFLPGFCLARLAIEGRDRVLMTLLALAILAGLVSNKDLLGEKAYDFVIWYGSVFWDCLLLFAGCCYALCRKNLMLASPRT